MNGNESWDKKAHNELVSQGLSWEHARIAVGIMAEQRQLADREGYDRGCNDGYKIGKELGYAMGYHAAMKGEPPEYDLGEWLDDCDSSN